MKARLIEAELVPAGFPVVMCCRVLGISTAGFYEWRQRQADPCRRHRDDLELTETIREIHRQSRGTYGSPRVHAELRLGQGIRVGRKRVERLMRADGIEGVTRRRRKGCTRRDRDAVPSDDLVVRKFRPDGPDRLWVADITEHPTGDGRVYCAVVIDAWSRMVVGWSIADRLRAELVVDALDMARWRASRPPVRPCTIPITEPKANSRGRRNTSITEVLRGTTERMGCNRGRACADAFAETTAGLAA